MSEKGRTLRPLNLPLLTDILKTAYQFGGALPIGGSDGKYPNVPRDTLSWITNIIQLGTWHGKSKQLNLYQDVLRYDVDSPEFRLLCLRNLLSRSNITKVKRSKYSPAINRLLEFIYNEEYTEQALIRFKDDDTFKNDWGNELSVEFALRILWFLGSISSTHLPTRRYEKHAIIQPGIDVNVFSVQFREIHTSKFMNELHGDLVNIHKEFEKIWWVISPPLFLLQLEKLEERGMLKLQEGKHNFHRRIGAYEIQ